MENAHEIAIATINEAKSDVNSPATPNTVHGNAIVVIFDGTTFSVNDNGDGVDELTEQEALRVLEHDIQQNIDR